MVFSHWRAAGSNIAFASNNGKDVYDKMKPDPTRE